MKGGEEKFIWDILREQVENSPHEYICKKWKDDLYVPHGVVIDAGVCEGNFALRYIESIDHLYIVESDPKWIKPLQMTFSPWKDKVTFIFKYLSDNTDDNSITIDAFIQENHVDFLKMDIEGFEKKALEGASNTIKRGISKCTVCTYHRRNHQSDIERIFSKNNYATWFSNGYMFFRYDPEEYIDFELRKGVIYAEFQKG